MRKNHPTQRSQTGVLSEPRLLFKLTPPNSYRWLLSVNGGLKTKEGLPTVHNLRFVPSTWDAPQNPRHCQFLPFSSVIEAGDGHENVRLITYCGPDTCDPFNEMSKAGLDPSSLPGRLKNVKGRSDHRHFNGRSKVMNTGGSWRFNLKRVESKLLRVILIIDF